MLMIAMKLMNTATTVRHPNLNKGEKVGMKSTRWVPLPYEKVLMPQGYILTREYDT